MSPVPRAFGVRLPDLRQAPAGHVSWGALTTFLEVSAGKDDGDGDCDGHLGDLMLWALVQAGAVCAHHDDPDGPAALSRPRSHGTYPGDRYRPAPGWTWLRVDRLVRSCAVAARLGTASLLDELRAALGLRTIREVHDAWGFESRHGGSDLTADAEGPNYSWRSELVHEWSCQTVEKLR